jgi:hypothetical protein
VLELPFSNVLAASTVTYDLGRALSHTPTSLD